MLMYAPRRQRELFDYFRQYRREAGVEGLIRNWDLSEAGPHQIYYSVLGRLPEPARAKRAEAFDAAAQYANALKSPEFQSGILPSLLQAYPEKTRMIFVHIPKCAGSHLASKLVENFPVVNFRLMDKNWINSENLFEALRLLASRLTKSDQIFPYGHLTLKWYLNRGLIRYGDFPFSVVRDPTQVVMSQVNYILTRFVRDPGLKSIDTKDWARFVDQAKLSSSIANKDFRDLALEILFRDELVQKNIMCHYLGTGTAQSAFETCASASVELTDLEHYDAWLSTRLGVEAGRPTNVSQRYVGVEDLGGDGLKRIAEVTEQDALLLEKVRTLMSEPNRRSISGVELL
jgi:hypothetical protein